MNKVILVADDNPVMRDALSKLFEFEDGLELCEQAEWMVRTPLRKPSVVGLIIVDFSMPVMNGLDAARTIKTIMPAVPIILFTIHANELFPSGTVASGIDAIVSKAEMMHLVDRTRALLTASA